MSELSKYIKSTPATLNRSEIQLADYNPRTISDEAKKTLRRGIRKYGLVGGIVVNKQTGNTLVQGHQRLSVMDDLQHYDPTNPDTDYSIQCDLIDIDPKSEKELVILLNNPNAQGQWDYQRLKQLVPLIDYKDAGLTDADLSMIGVDFLMPTVSQNETETQITQLLLPDFNSYHSDNSDNSDTTDDNSDQQPLDPKIQHIKELKQQVNHQAAQKAANLTAYIMLSFDNNENLLEFLSIFDLAPNTTIIKGEELISLMQSQLDEE